MITLTEHILKGGGHHAPDERDTGEPGVDDHPSTLMMRADELEEAGEKLQAARLHLAVVQHFQQQGNIREVIRLARASLQLLLPRKVGDEMGYHRLVLSLIAHLMVASHNRWVCHPEKPDPMPLQSLADAAQRAVSRLHEPALAVQVAIIQGYVAFALYALDDALPHLQHALTTAETTDDLYGQFFALTHLAAIWTRRDVLEGLEMLYRAQSRYQTEIATTIENTQNHTLQRHLACLYSHIGLAELHNGDFTSALSWLQRGNDALARMHNHDDIAEVVNLIAVVYIAMGRFEDAEVLLATALTTIEGRDPHLQRCYARALLGKLYLEWERIDDARTPLDRAWSEMRELGHTEQEAMVVNSYAELLNHTSYRQRDLLMAEQVLEENMETSHQGAAIQAHVLRAALALEHNQPAMALEMTSRAVAQLHERQALAWLRIEELYYWHARALQASGEHAAATPHLARAAALVRRKAATIVDEAYRKQFFERVPLNRAILAAVGA